MTDCPLLIEFAAATHLHREAGSRPTLPILRNGPPGTFVVFADGRRIGVPTDQIVFADDSTGSARVGFGGMDFVGLEDGRLVFTRVRDLRPEEELSPERGRTMRLEPGLISAILVDGRPVWP
jgi:hypothetical protein